MSKGKRIDLRVTEEELAAVKEKAGEWGVSVTALLVDAARAVELVPEGSPQPSLIAIDATSWCRVQRELNHQGVNLNQSVRAFNATGRMLTEARDSGGVGREEVAAAGSSLMAVRKELEGIRASLEQIAVDVRSVASATGLLLPRLPPGAPRPASGEGRGDARA